MSSQRATWWTTALLAVRYRAILDWTITWIVGPALLLAMLIAGITLIGASWGDPPPPSPAKGRDDYSEQRRYERAKEDRRVGRVMAFCAGILGALIVIIRDVLVKQITFSDSVTDSARTKIYVAVFLILGFLVTAVSAHVRTFLTSSLFIFTLAFISVSAFYFYASLSEVRGPILISMTSLSMGGPGLLLVDSFQPTRLSLIR